MRTDEQLIEQFLAGQRDEAESAFEVLVRRHGPMVLGVCRQVLNRHQDAEDAFQGTFLALARKAGTIQNRRVLGGWLYQVAHRIAGRMRVRAARCRWLPGITDEAAALEEPWTTAARSELRPILHTALDRLPEKYRTLVVHCYLEGKTNEEAARLLDCPIGTVKGRLSRARGMLRNRLSRYGLEPDHPAG
jgi:RNA polymerase sigma factor (sigma-70 family)